MLKKSHVALGLAAVLLSSLATTVFLIGDQTIRKKNLFSMPKPKQVEYEKWTDHDVLVVYKHGASRNSIGISWGEGFDLDFQFKLRDALEKKKLGWKIIKLKGAKGLYESLMFDHVPGFVIFIVHPKNAGFVVTYNGSTEGVGYFVSLLDTISYAPEKIKEGEGV